LGSRRSQPTIHLPRRPNFSQLTAHLRHRPISPPTFLYKSGHPSHNPNPPLSCRHTPSCRRTSSGGRPPPILRRPATSPPPAVGPPLLLLLCPCHLPSSSASPPLPPPLAPHRR
jgi:hypothetical protein